ncbi:MAG: DoxX family protein [Candidatus Tyrphobacter sp.]
MNPFTPAETSPRTSLALLLVRAIVGVGFIFHGLMKVPYPTMWMGPHGFAPHWLQGIVTFVETIGGACIICGLLTPLFAFLLSIDMIVAIFKFHIPAGGHFVGGRAAFDVPLTYLIVMIATLVGGPGLFSLDAALWRRRPR